MYVYVYIFLIKEHVSIVIISQCDVLHYINVYIYRILHNTING